MTTAPILTLTGQSHCGAAFDDFDRDYYVTVQKGLQATGESKTNLIRRRLTWLNHQLMKAKFKVELVLDYGCGCGDTCPYVFKTLKPATMSVPTYLQNRSSYQTNAMGMNTVSSLKRASWRHPATSTSRTAMAFPFMQRLLALQRVVQLLRPGGLIAFWENNPWNPGTRYAMRRIPFDRDAIMLSAGESRRLLRDAGFDILETSYLCLFPHRLYWLRPLETTMACLPIGGQTQILARRATTKVGLLGSDDDLAFVAES
jgi:SAM-dependent methyltransferase